MRPRVAIVAIVLAGGIASCAAPAGSPGAPAGDASGASTASGSAPPATSPSAGGSIAASSSAMPSAGTSEEPTTMPSSGTFAITSDAFDDGLPIPTEFTCRGADLSPALAWSGVPDGTLALVLFVDDPDGRDWVHWSVLDLDPSTSSLPRDVRPDQAGLQQGRNDFGNVGYGGPCPPSGTHHYRFTLSALAKPLGLAGHPDGAAIRAALRSAAVLGTARLVGTFRA